MASTIRVQEHVRAVIDSDGAVLLDLRRGKYFSLNEIGVEIWNQIEAGRSLAEIEAHLARGYDASTGDLRQDLKLFLERLAGEGLIDV